MCMERGCVGVRGRVCAKTRNETKHLVTAFWDGWVS